jgi:hypothetical protein
MGIFHWNTYFLHFSISIDLFLKLPVKSYLTMNRYIGKIVQPTVKRTLSFNNTFSNISVIYERNSHKSKRDNSSQIIKKNFKKYLKKKNIPFSRLSLKIIGLRPSNRLCLSHIRYVHVYYFDLHNDEYAFS